MERNGIRGGGVDGNEGGRFGIYNRSSCIIHREERDTTTKALGSLGIPDHEHFF